LTRKFYAFFLSLPKDDLDFFFKENCGGVPHSASFFIILKRKGLYRRKKTYRGTSGGRKEMKNRRAIQLYLSIEQFEDGESPSLLKDEGAPDS
jgi:hypothetical protein